MPDAGDPHATRNAGRSAARDGMAAGAGDLAGSGPRLVADNAGLVAEGLGKRYRKRPVLRDVSISLQRGEVVGLLGPNGAGKTTCFYIVIGLIAPDSGTISLDGADLTELPMYRRARLGIGYLPQEASIFRKLTVADNVGAILETVEPSRVRRKERLAELLAELGLTEKANRKGADLSGGERRRVEITRALVLDPKFMLLDEPFAGVDPIAVIDIQKIIEQLRSRDIGVIITDHNVRETLSICDRAYIIKDGRILRLGTPAEIAEDPEVREAYLGRNFSLH